MNNPLKEKIRYWFEFLRLAHESHDPIVKTNLKKTVEFYAPWDDYRTQRFDIWWRSHSRLFKDPVSLSVPKVGDVVTEDAFYVRVPFTYAPSTLGKIVAEMYNRELTQRQMRKKKTRKVYGGTYSLSRDDYQVSQFYYYLVFVRDVYLPVLRGNPKAKTGEYVARSKDVFGKLRRKTTVVRQVPFTNSQASYESLSRLVRRYRQLSEKLLRNVSEGSFPGDYEETFIKNQSQKRAEEIAKLYAIKPTKRSRGTSTSRFVKKIDRVSGTDPYAGASRKTRSDKGKKRGSYSKG
ncbi:hypothetical protein [Orrella daihaiensis]|uniref:Uncharacterized protein n=1 Tax=Orrella daihaiensis TaxID=2782176 RepID=A0ABY4ARP8_9BURK|nr:hypothetical protein [Orrella daihaiensis]UOD50704.1 hypothetical protein DHf2319_01860 [Orrella daihaiensis]